MLLFVMIRGELGGGECDCEVRCCYRNQRGCCSSGSHPCHHLCHLWHCKEKNKIKQNSRDFSYKKCWAPEHSNLLQRFTIWNKNRKTKTENRSFCSNLFQASEKGVSPLQSKYMITPFQARHTWVDLLFASLCCAMRPTRRRVHT